MLGFNWIDCLTIVFLAVTIIIGLRIGVLSQLFVISGFFGSLFICGWLFPLIIRFHDPMLRTTINGSLVLLASIYAAMRGFDAGQSVHWSFRLGKLRKDRKLETAETIFGALPGLCAGLTLVWLLGVAVGRLPFVGLSNSVNSALIVQTLTNKLPSVPAVFAEFNRHIDPNAQPLVFIEPKPEPTFNYDSQAISTATMKATPSLVRITSFSCGGIVSGSGFVIAPDLIATDAHVIAGSKRPIVKRDNESYEGVPIYFDPTLDLAIIRVHKLNAPHLSLVSTNVTQNTTVAVLGYPGGNYRTEPGIIRDTRATTSASIYSMGSFGKGVYVVQTQVEYGNSGGPIVTQSGEVAGIIFSKSNTVNDIAYALTSVHINDALQRSKQSYTRVGTGACMV